MAAIRVLCLLVAVSGLVFAVSAGGDFVLTLDAKNFDEEVKKNDFIVVEFYAPWCGHCKQLAPEYEKAAGALTSAGSGVVLAKVDADNAANKDLAKKYGVQGFPTIKIFRHGDLENPTEYKGPRDAPGIVSFLQKQAGPATKEIKSYDEIKGVLDTDSVAVVGVFADVEAPEFGVFSKAAEALRAEYTFLYTTDQGLLGDEDIPYAPPFVRVVTTFDEGKADTAELELESLKAFVKSRSLPTVIEFSQDPKDRPFLTRAFESPSKKCLLFLSYNDSDMDSFRAKFKGVATVNKEQGIVFLIGDAKANEHALKYFGVDEKHTPAIIIHDPAIDAKYYRTSVGDDDLGAFIENYLAGKEERKIKSEPIPTKNDKPVKVAVANNFKELVLESGKNVLIEFYAPWCGHCKKLEPIYKAVGKAFKDDPDVVIAKMDYTANDLPTDQFSVKGFPTIYFYSSEGEVVLYEGDRSKASLIEFVKKQKASAAAANESSSEEVEAAAEAAEAAADAAEAAADVAQEAKAEL